MNGLYLVVDMRQDLMDGDITYRLLWDIADGDEPAQIVDGVYVTQGAASTLLQDYVAAWERAWIATAEAMGHEAIAAGGGSPEAHEHIRRNSAAALDRSDIGVSAVDAAMETVWNHCPFVTLEEVLNDATQ